MKISSLFSRHLVSLEDHVIASRERDQLPPFQLDSLWVFGPIALASTSGTTVGILIGCQILAEISPSFPYQCVIQSRNLIFANLVDSNSHGNARTQIAKAIFSNKNKSEGLTISKT